MNKFSDRNVIIIMLVTVCVVFAFIFSVASPERKVIESPIIWKEEFSNISILDNDKIQFSNYKII